MENSVLIAGFGGQGIMLMGKLLGYSAVNENKMVTFNPAYGAEQRGGTANCIVVISEKEILLPAPSKIETLIAMNEPSLDKFIGKLKTNGNCIINSSLISKKIESNIVNGYYVPANEIALKLGNVKVANLVMLGAYVAVNKTLDLNKTKQTIVKVLGGKPELVKQNLDAFDIGISSVSN